MYIVFDPSFGDSPREAWGTIRDGKIRRIMKDHDRSFYDNANRDDEALEYYFGAKEQEGGHWTGLYYDQDIGENVFSYSRAVYADGQYLGVVGADISAEDTVDQIASLNEYADGFTVLMDEDYQCITASEGFIGNKKTQFLKALDADEKNVGEEASGLLRFIRGRQISKESLLEKTKNVSMPMANEGVN